MVVKGENQTMKDRNLLSCKKMRKVKKQSGLLQFKNSDIVNICNIIKKDTDLMMKLKLIDYSLLLAVERLKTPVPP